MNTNELIDFGIMFPALRASIKAIYKSGILNEHKVQRCINLTNDNSIDVYALPIIVALSFRLNTLGAYKVREYAIDKLITNKRAGIVFMLLKTFRVTPEKPCHILRTSPSEVGRFAKS